MPLGASAVASEICEWHRCTSGWNRCILLSLIVNIRSSFTHLHSSSLTHLHSSSTSSCLCSCHSSQKSHHFFRFYQQNKSSEFIVSSDRLVIIAKGFLKLPKLHMLIKQKSLSLPRNLALGTFGEFLIVLSPKVDLLYLLYSTARSCCLLHLIKQNCELKSFLRTLILLTQVSLHLFPFFN